MKTTLNDIMTKDKRYVAYKALEAVRDSLYFDSSLDGASHIDYCNSFIFCIDEKEYQELGHVTSILESGSAKYCFTERELSVVLFLLKKVHDNLYFDSSQDIWP